MIITTKQPKNWKDLQIKVGEILSNCGFRVEVEKEILSVRGKVEIDVYAEELIDGRKYSILCECKYWGSNIPQNVIHGFRTVINDLGCNIGYIITTSKYQSGSKQAAEKTNVELLTWESFQDVFFESWYANYFCNKIQDELSIPSDYSLVAWFDDLTKEDKRLYSQLKNQLSEIDEVTSSFPRSFLKELNPKYFSITPLPLLGNLFNPSQYFGEIPKEILIEPSYLEFMNKLLLYGKEIIEQFNRLDEKYAQR